MSLEPKEQWDPLDQMDLKAHEANKAFQEYLEPGAHQVLLEIQESQVSQDPKDLRDCLALPAIQEPKVIQGAPAGS